VGHQHAFLRPRLSARYRFSQGTFARTRGNGRNAPFPAVALMFAGSVKNRLRQRDGFKRNIIQVTIT